MSETKTLSEDDVADAWDAVRELPEAHAVEWTLEREYVRGRIVCKGDDDSQCRAYCSNECEVWPCEHMPKMGKSCMVVEWFQDCASDYYDGPETQLRDGLIEPIWTGDGYDWRYAAEVSS